MESLFLKKIKMDPMYIYFNFLKVSDGKFGNLRNQLI